jgi:hypothetical protein
MKLGNEKSPTIRRDSNVAQWYEKSNLRSIEAHAERVTKDITFPQIKGSDDVKKIIVESYREYVNLILSYSEKNQLLENYIKDGKYIIYIK